MRTDKRPRRKRHSDAPGSPRTREQSPGQPVASPAGTDLSELTDEELERGLEAFVEERARRRQAAQSPVGPQTKKKLERLQTQLESVKRQLAEMQAGVEKSFDYTQLKTQRDETDKHIDRLLTDRLYNTPEYHTLITKQTKLTNAIARETGQGPIVTLGPLMNEVHPRFTQRPKEIREVRKKPLKQEEGAREIDSFLKQNADIERERYGMRVEPVHRDATVVIRFEIGERAKGLRNAVKWLHDWSERARAWNQQHGHLTPQAFQEGLFHSGIHLHLQASKGRAPRGFWKTMTDKWNAGTGENKTPQQVRLRHYYFMHRKA